MSLPNATKPLLLGSTAAAGYQVSRSLRFNSVDSAYLTRTMGTAGSLLKWTFSCWAKRGLHPSLPGMIFSGGARDGISFQSLSSGTEGLSFRDNDGGAFHLTTSALYRDFSAWMHIVVAFDSAQATASDRVKIYVNGSQITSFSASTYPSLNYASSIGAAAAHTFGTRNATSYYLNSYLAEAHLVNNLALTASDFAQTDATTGQWVPKLYSGAYGTTGFKLTFADNSAATAATLGADSSGNGNNFTPTNLSVTAGVNNDSLTDTPTQYGSDTGAGGEVRGNYCTLNALRYGFGLASTATMSDGNLRFANSGDAGTAIATFAIPSTGKWYWEAVVPTQTYNFMMVGVVKEQQALSDLNNPVGVLSTGYAAYSSTGLKYINGTGSAYMGVTSQNTVMTIAYNADTGSLYVGAGGVWANGSGATNQTFANAVAAYTGITGTIHPAISFDTGHCYINFGQRAFTYTAPSGYKALCVQNLSTPTIVLPSAAFDAKLYTGTGSSQSITGLGFNPDLVWIKSRSAATDNTLYDSVRGAQARLESNTTDAEVTADNGLTAFDATGFTVNTLAQVNTSAATYVGWCWDESVSAGFDIVSYTGNGANRTVAHSLGVAPKVMIVKCRGNVDAWAVYHANLTSAAYALILNTTAAEASVPTYWNSTAPTSSVFSLGTSTVVNATSSTYIAYLWAEVAGFSKFGSYTGNGAADGPFVDCGFKPRFVLIKHSSGAGNNWRIWDSSRFTTNENKTEVYPSLNASEQLEVNGIDILSNGFKARWSSAAINVSAGTYIFMAFAESPFKYANAK